MTKTRDTIGQFVTSLDEDDYLLAVDKPAGVDTGGRRDRKGTGLVEILSELLGLGETLRPINRLSRYESGILLLAKQPALAEQLTDALNSGAIHQEYMSVVLGRMNRPWLEIKPTGSRAGRPPAVRSARRKPAPGGSARPGPKRPRDRAGQGKTRVLSVKQGKGRSYVRCVTEVQNTHALRAQLRGVRLRVLGDSLRDSAPRRNPADMT